MTTIFYFGYKISLNVCLADDDGCFGMKKTVDLTNASNGGRKSKILVGTFSIKFNSLEEFGPGDVSACGKQTFLCELLLTQILGPAFCFPREVIA